ncbi:hypothetical protein MJO28_001045 [Puccinia striiformis f. sp. tritici]|uniref:Uncharacterized protein n=1 Tax=Puccinia striiformis f. sp. tritici TaxID=168172 RepID=A0ACC0EZJ7_9BASI|nr:hypothetical protein MJO28_001045 [Puccinia striiformis f. sp. tritici]KAI7966933.1 hypothetical protein MJO29_000210 [Puccinia striiformis f. sp. tritici]
MKYTFAMWSDTEFTSPLERARYSWDHLGGFNFPDTTSGDHGTKFSNPSLDYRGPSKRNHASA